MSYVHDDQYGSLLGRCVRDRAVLFGRSCGVPEVSILGEYLQRVKAERDEAVKLFRLAVDEVESCHDCIRLSNPGLHGLIAAFLSRYDLPDDYDEA
jgi:hypothetical protein